MAKQTFGVIVSTRSFFPSHLVKTAREAVTALLDRLGYGYVMVGEEDTQYGAVLSYEEAKTCARLFRENRDRIDGILVILPNFGEELGIAEAISLAELHVPVLVQACDDSFDKLDMANRRDAFCGKISLCNNLYQRNIPFTATTLHTCPIDSEEFAADVRRFAGVCRVVKGLGHSRIAMLGARPVAFNTVRFSEKILQKYGIAVQTVDFSEVIFKAMHYPDGQKVEDKIEEIKAYGTVPSSIAPELLKKQAKLCLAIAETVEELECDASTVQCWDSVENNYGCATCLAMSMMGNNGKPSACESDVTGAVSMLAATLAAQAPSALMDWNNNLREDRNACIALHCSNFPKDFFQSEVEIECLDVLGSTLGRENCFGACKGQVAAGDMTFVRLSTDDQRGKLKAYIGEGVFRSEKLPTKGGLANCYIENLQKLMRVVCKNGYEHHVCFVRGHVADILEEAFSNYLGIEVYRHR
ncbi:MAG: fucose isomerase [Lachnospiraceae bacterium]|nr:fucose isomerase [Lachnospiraceae bacterium]